MPEAGQARQMPGVSRPFFGTVKVPVTRPPWLVVPGGAPPSITARPLSRSSTSRAPLTCEAPRVRVTAADHGDDALVEIVDRELAARGLGRASNDDSAAGVEPLDLDSAGIGVGHGEPCRVEGQLGLADDDIAGEDRPVGAVLDLDPVGRDVHRRFGIVALERRSLGQSAGRATPARRRPMQ